MMALVLMLLIAPISIITMLLITRWFINQRGEREQTDRVTEIWSRRQEWGEALCRRIIDRQLEAGMTPDMVRLAWGEPQAIKRPPGQTDEQWLYDIDQSGPIHNQVTFQANKVSEWTGSPLRTDRDISPWLVVAILVGLVVVIGVAVFIVLITAGG